jgi:hypothetical protein
MRTQENMAMFRNHLAGLALRASHNGNNKSLDELKAKHFNDKHNCCVSDLVEVLVEMNDDEILATYDSMNVYGKQEFDSILTSLDSLDEEMISEGFMDAARRAYDSTKKQGISNEKNVRVRKLMTQPISLQVKAAFQNRVTSPLGRKAGNVAGKIRNKISSVVSRFASRANKSPRNKPAAKKTATSTPQKTAVAKKRSIASKAKSLKTVMKSKVNNSSTAKTNP